MDEQINFVARHYRKGTFNPDTAWAQFKKRIHIAPQKRRLVPVYWAAAMFAGLVVAGILYFSAGRGEKLVANADDSVFTLPDRSTARMKSGARLEYDENFGETDRAVKMRGEISFAVAHDESKPFIVSTPSATIKVLGTVFDVCENEQGTTLEVASGKVLFTPADPAVSFICTANMNAQYKSGERTIKYRSPDFRISVNAGKNMLLFENATLKDIGGVLSQYFDVAVEIPRNEAQFTFSSAFTHKNIYEIVRIINLTLDSHVTITE